jgi:hypothetical protein
VALGFRILALAGDASKAYGVVTNPPKTTVVAFAPGDRVIVVAED